MAERQIDFGVLDPATTEVFGPPDSFHVLLRGQRGGSRGWPYRPEVVQRRNGRWAAVLNVTLLLNADGRKALADAAGVVRIPQGPTVGIGDFCNSFGPHQPSQLRQLFDLFLVKMLRPAAPQGVEWDAPGGIVEAGESSPAAADRELHEEAGPVQVLARSRLFQNLQFSSGVYREWYDIYGVLATGDPQLAELEGALEVLRVPYADAGEWIRVQQRIPSEDPRCCWVDGKVLLAAYHLAQIL